MIVAIYPRMQFLNDVSCIKQEEAATQLAEYEKEAKRAKKRAKKKQQQDKKSKLSFAAEEDEDEAAGEEDRAQNDKRQGPQTKKEPTHTR